MFQHNVQLKENAADSLAVNFLEECRWRETLAPHLPNVRKSVRARRSRQRKHNAERKTQTKEELDAPPSQPAKSPTVTYDDEGKPEGLNFHDF
jgi:hypothetical protein